jgi:Uma2 family endonuclease
MTTVLSPVEERILLHNVSWETYEQLLSNYENSSSPRFAFDRGTLEIMSPSSEHEELSDLITQLVFILAEEWNFEYRSFGRTTFRREELESGFEPDGCFYIQSVDRISGVKRLDLAAHPPPDIAIEVDVTSPSLNKLPIYARIGVPEIWRYDGQKVTILILQESEYQESQESRSISRLTSSALSQLIVQGTSMKRSAWVRAVREWARSNL